MITPVINFKKINHKLRILNFVVNQKINSMTASMLWRRRRWWWWRKHPFLIHIFTTNPFPRNWFICNNPFVAISACNKIHPFSISFSLPQAFNKAIKVWQLGCMEASCMLLKASLRFPHLMQPWMTLSHEHLLLGASFAKVARVAFFIQTEEFRSGSWGSKSVSPMIFSLSFSFH